MKVTASKTAFQPVEIKISLENFGELRALRRLYGGLPHSELRKAVLDSNVKGPVEDVDLASHLSTRLYEVTQDLYIKESG